MINPLTSNSMYDASLNGVNLKKDETKAESFENALKAAAAEKDDEKLKQACQDFESYFIQIMFKEMRNTTMTGQGLIPTSNAEEIFRSMLDEEFSKEAAKGEGMGLAKTLYEQMKRQGTSVLNE